MRFATMSRMSMLAGVAKHNCSDRSSAPKDLKKSKFSLSDAEAAFWEVQNHVKIR